MIIMNIRACAVNNTKNIDTVNLLDKIKVWQTEPKIHDLIRIIYAELKQATPCTQMYFLDLLSGL